MKCLYLSSGEDDGRRGRKKAESQGKNICQNGEYETGKGSAQQVASLPDPFLPRTTKPQRAPRMPCGDLALSYDDRVPICGYSVMIYSSYHDTRVPTGTNIMCHRGMGAWACRTDLRRIISYQVYRAKPEGVLRL